MITFRNAVVKWYNHYLILGQSSGNQSRGQHLDLSLNSLCSSSQTFETSLKIINIIVTFYIHFLKISMQFFNTSSKKRNNLNFELQIQEYLVTQLQYFHDLQFKFTFIFLRTRIQKQLEKNYHFCCILKCYCLLLYYFFRNLLFGLVDAK